MIVYLNNEEVVIEDGASLYALLDKKELSNKKGIAVAVNQNVVSASNWQSKLLLENDKILVISATKGG